MKLKTAALMGMMLNLASWFMVVDGVPAAGETAPWRVHHDLSVSLFPQASSLTGRDRMRIQPAPTGPVELVLSPRANIQNVALNGREHPHSFDQGILKLVPGPAEAGPFELAIGYTCRFDDPVPKRPVNTDNPGYGVSGTISAAGTFILAGAGWYPRMIGSRESVDLRLDAPEGTVAVTSGRLDAVTREGGRTVSRWTSDQPVEGLSLSAGPYVVDRRTEAGHSAATFLLAENRRLASRYLEASLHHMKRYSDLFGPYPFDAFAVVENFFPTGYGFPGYTLMGGAVLRLPFIPETSLPHEIVHNWWGNGVLVDGASGNWCEGLATYTADYLLKEQTSPEAARDYRRQAMRNYATLTSASTDLPLARFRSRTDPATKAVGYDKSAMVFHMLRRLVGEEAFWRGLRDLYGQFRFESASWKDLQEVFEQRADRSLESFFRQWIERPGAPRLNLEDVRREGDGRGYLTTGRLVQEAPFYDVSLDLVLTTEGASIRNAVRLSGPAVGFAIASDDRPISLVADPDHDLFRRLSREEMPPTVNTLRGSSSVVLIVSDRWGGAGGALARYFCRAMGIDPVRLVAEADFSPASAVGQDLVFIGLPRNPQNRRLLPDEPTLAPGAFEFDGQRFDDSQDVLFFVSRTAHHADATVSLLHAPSAAAAHPAAAKISHYGRYSYLAFSDGRNRIKGTWNVLASPMMVTWEQPADLKQGAAP